MRLMRSFAILLSVMLQVVAGCGGGGGGGTVQPSTKTATLKLSTQSNVLGDVMGCFDLKLTLPSVSVLQIDSLGIPLSSVVYLSGEFAGAAPISSDGVNYNHVDQELTVTYPSSSARSYALGEFITIMTTVPVTYVPNISDVKITSFSACAPVTGNPLTSITATVSSFN